jgi:LysR family glycine cleavage system transcriptional activator
MCARFDPIHKKAFLTENILIQPVGISKTWSSFARVPGLEADLFVDTHGLAVDLAISGAGVALTHALITAPSLKDGRLAALPLPPVSAEEGYFLFQKPGAQLSAQRAFADWLENLIIQSRPSLN